MGQSAIFYASQGGNYRFVKFLINNGADINLEDNSGSFPLINAVRSGNKDLVELMLSEGADLKSTNNGQTALMNAAAFGEEDITKILISAGSEVEKTERQGMTALDLAKSRNNEKVINILENADKIIRKDKKEILLKALENNNPKKVETSLNKNINKKDDFLINFLMIRRPPRSTLSSSSAASDVYKRQSISPKLWIYGYIYMIVSGRGALCTE